MIPANHLSCYSCCNGHSVLKSQSINNIYDEQQNLHSNVTLVEKALKGQMHMNVVNKRLTSVTIPAR